jgi:hypothetical protein
MSGAEPIIEIEFTGKEMFVKFNGERIAKRGDHRNWITLVPGYRVSSPPDHSTISVDVVPDTSAGGGDEAQKH